MTNQFSLFELWKIYPLFSILIALALLIAHIPFFLWRATVMDKKVLSKRDIKITSTVVAGSFFSLIVIGSNFNDVISLIFTIVIASVSFYILSKWK